MEEPLVSVIIPVYNMERYLERCLDSVLNNTYRNLEVICIDDGSKDRSLEILRRYEAADSRIVVIAKENGGVSSARNAGLDRMTGEYVTFVDPDDYVHPQYVEFLYRAIKTTGTNIAICTFQQVGDGAQLLKGDIPFEPQVYSFSQIAREHKLRAYSGGRLLLSLLANSVRFRTDLQYGEDTVFFAELCEIDQLGGAAVLFAPLYYYYQREDSLTKTADNTHQLQYIRTIVQKLLLENKKDDLYLDQAIRVCLSSRYLCTYILPDRKAASEYTKHLHSLLGRLRKTEIYSIPQKLGTAAFILCPRVYWLYRVSRDPSMLQWEKAERRKRQGIQ